MTPEVFAIAEKAMASISLYRAHYASGQEFQTRFQDILSLLRQTAANASLGNGGKNFLLAFADALEVSNKPGEYVPIAQR